MQIRDGKVLNPATGRWVIVTGKIGKELLAKKSSKSKSTQSKEKTFKSDTSSKKEKSSPKKDKKSSSSHKKPSASLKQIHIAHDTIDRLDELKLELSKFKNIKITHDKTDPFIPLFNENVFSIRARGDDAFVQGLYDKAVSFVIYKSPVRTDLIMRSGTTYVRLQDMHKLFKTGKCNLDICLQQEKEPNNHITESCLDFLASVFGVTAIELTSKTYEYVVPSTYQEDTSVQKYDYPKPQPTVSVVDREDRVYDPSYVSNMTDSIVYVFHVQRPNYPAMTGYVPLCISVVYRVQKNINYKYTTLFRLTYPSWAVCDDPEDIGMYMKEIRNIIRNVPYLGKFRGISPYPRTVIGCKKI